jgi:hypothetical protein
MAKTGDYTNYAPRTHPSPVVGEMAIFRQPSRPVALKCHANEQMKTGFSFTASALVLVAVGLLAAQEWTEFSSAEGRFSILMPGKPTQGTVDLRMRDSTVTAHAFTALSPSIDLMCGYADYPWPQPDIERVFDDTRNGSLNGVHGTLLSEQKTTLGGYPGRRFRSTGIGNAFVDEEMYFVGQRFYLITITTATKNPNKDINKIFASFHFKPQNP